ncbi:MAG: HAD family hydrolase [Floccifex sp.]
MIRHIVFDWNGTLMDDVQFSLDIENQLFKERGLRIIEMDEYKKSFCHPVKDYYKKIGFDFTQYSFEELSEEFIDIYNKTYTICPLTPYTKEILKEFKEKNISCSILSASHQKYLEEQVQFYEIDSYFMDIVGCDTIHATGKVAQGIQWMKEHQFKEEECLFVGDTLHDYESAKAMHMPCVLVCTGHQDKELLKQTGCKVIEDLSELMKILEED